MQVAGDMRLHFHRFAMVRGNDFATLPAFGNPVPKISERSLFLTTYSVVRETSRSTLRPDQATKLTQKRPGQGPNIRGTSHESRKTQEHGRRSDGGNNGNCSGKFCHSARYGSIGNLGCSGCPRRFYDARQPPDWDSWGKWFTDMECVS